MKVFQIKDALPEDVQLQSYRTDGEKDITRLALYADNWTEESVDQTYAVLDQHLEDYRLQLNFNSNRLEVQVQ